MAELVLQGVSKTFPGHVAAVQDLDLTIHDHELVVLVGPSGCGKTTTLRLIAGLDPLDHGVIRIAGRCVNQRAPDERNVALVFQQSALYPHLSVLDNMAFSLRMRQGRRMLRRLWKRWRPHASRSQVLDEPAIRAEVRRAAARLGLDRLLDRKPHQLSGGERQRVALGRAIVRQPAAFLLDEPLSQLDPPQRVALRQVIRDLPRQGGAAVLYVTHDQAEALSLGDRVAVMQQGRIHQVGTPQEIYEQPRDLVVARFVGDPAMNVIAGSVVDERDEQGRHVRCFRSHQLVLPLGADREPWSAAAHIPHQLRQVSVGIRPEDIQLAEWASVQETVNPNSSHAPDPAATTRWTRGQIAEVEFRGAMCVVQITLANGPQPKVDPCQVAAVTRHRHWGRGQEVAVGWPTERLHWFDTAGGRNSCATPASDTGTR